MPSAKKSKKTSSDSAEETGAEIRISFQLPVELDSQLTELAKIKGTAKSKLLRDWLESIPEVSLKPSLEPDPKLTSYNLRLPKTIYDSARETAQSYGLSLSSYLRLLITSRLNNEDAESVAKYLFRRDDILVILEELEAKHEHSVWELEVLMRLHTQLGNYDVAWNYIHQLEKRISRLPADDIFFAKLLLSRATIAWMKRQLINSRKYLMQSLEIAEKQQDKFLLARIYGQLSVVSAILDDFESAIIYGHKGLAYIEVTESPVATMRGYVALAGQYAHLGDLKHAKFMLDRAEELLNTMPNPGLRTFFTTRAGWVHLKLGELPAAREYLVEAQELAESRDSKKELFYIYEDLGLLAIQESNWQEADAHFQKAEVLEARMRDAEVSRTQWWQLLVRAACGEGDDAYKQMRKLVELRREVANQSTGEYILACIGFLFAQDRQLQLRGEKCLQELAEEGKYELIRQAARSTLANRKVSPF